MKSAIVQVWVWQTRDRRAAHELEDILGLIPTFINEDDPRSAREQFDAAYIGGWSPFKGFTMRPDGDLLYPGDPPTKLLAWTKLHDETIRVYEHAWVAIVQPDGSYEIARMD
jgi:hypothetical protein